MTQLWDIRVLVWQAIIPALAGFQRESRTKKNQHVSKLVGWLVGGWVGWLVTAKITTAESKTRSILSNPMTPGFF